MSISSGRYVPNRMRSRTAPASANQPLLLGNAGRYYGLGRAWEMLSFVKGRRYLY